MNILRRERNFAADLHVSEKARDPSTSIRAGSFDFAPGKAIGVRCCFKTKLSTYYRIELSDQIATAALELKHRLSAR